MGAGSRAPQALTLALEPQPLRCLPKGKQALWVAPWSLRVHLLSSLLSPSLPPSRSLLPSSLSPSVLSLCMLTHSGPQLCPAQHHGTILSQVAGRGLGLGALVLVPGTWHRASEFPMESLYATLACLLTNGRLSRVPVPSSPALRKGPWLANMGQGEEQSVLGCSQCCCVLPGWCFLCPFEALGYSHSMYPTPERSL